MLRGLTDNVAFSSIIPIYATPHPGKGITDFGFWFQCDVVHCHDNPNRHSGIPHGASDTGSPPVLLGCPAVHPLSLCSESITATT